MPIRNKRKVGGVMDREEVIMGIKSIKYDWGRYISGYQQEVLSLAIEMINRNKSDKLIQDVNNTGKELEREVE